MKLRVDPSPSFRRAVQTMRCHLALHGPYRAKSDLAWCLECGATFEVRYDGLGYSWRRRPDLHYGRPK